VLIFSLGDNSMEPVTDALSSNVGSKVGSCEGSLSGQGTTTGGVFGIAPATAGSVTWVLSMSSSVTKLRLAVGSAPERAVCTAAVKSDVVPVVELDVELVVLPVEEMEALVVPPELPLPLVVDVLVVVAATGETVNIL
jgi:hypothetical protein